VVTLKQRIFPTKKVMSEVEAKAFTEGLIY
jgi:hypothetical protein